VLSAERQVWDVHDRRGVESGGPLFNGKPSSLLEWQLHDSVLTVETVQWAVLDGQERALLKGSARVAPA
jgi:hypothetical protein